MSDTNHYRILLADDHAILRQSLKVILKEQSHLEVIGEAGDGGEFLHLLNSNAMAPQMIILDISMLILSGLEAARVIKINRPEIKILILSMHKEKEYLSEALSVGVEGYLLKEYAGIELFNAIESIRRGGTYLSPLLIKLAENENS
jgi:DNA-binding NarL/FixJ family response regulator